MALIKCRECGGEVSTAAKSCPHCGAKIPRTSVLGKIVLVVGLVWMLVWFFGKFDHWNLPPSISPSQSSDQARLAQLTPEQRAAEDAARAKAEKFSAARGACLIVLKKSLNDADTAKLESTSSWYVEDRKDGTILVQPSGRAKNAFGAYIYGVWDCIAKPEGENIRVLSLKQIRP